MKPEKYLKPWSTVFVEMPVSKRRFIGELVSFPTPEGTIMVRQAPGIAATMIEVPVSAITGPNAGYNWLHFAEISGKGALPVDMLRYDYAAPFNFTFDEESGLCTLEPGFEDGPLVLVACGRYKHVPAFTPKRWESFQWECKPFKVERFAYRDKEIKA